jgi:very-short-patch-repair endonuclease
MATAKHSGVELWVSIARVAERQHGLVSRKQLRDLGMTEGGISAAIATARIYRVFPQVYAVGHRRIGERGGLLAAVLACGDGAVVSHGSAAFLLGLWDRRPALVDVIAAIDAGRKVSGIRRRYVPSPPADERMSVDGVPSTTPSRTIVDTAGIVGRSSLSRTIEQAAVLRVLDVPEIDRILAGPRRRGSRQLRAILIDWRRYRPGTHVRSRMEAKLLPLLSRHDLPIPGCNEKVRIDGEMFEVDFLWRDRKLVVETDGGRFHDNPNAASRDSHRNRAFAGAGYLIPRLGWEDLRDRPEATMAEIARLLRPPS